MVGGAGVMVLRHVSALALCALVVAPLQAQPAVASAPAPAAAPASSASASAPSLAGPTRCRFMLPAGWQAHQVRWTGDCRAGLAQGLGILRALQGKPLHGNQVQAVFYGRLKDGRLLLGAIEQDGGYAAGRFENGRAVQDGERNALIQAFAEASAAARQVAQRYQAAGNPASARYYRQKATQLAQQMD